MEKINDMDMTQLVEQYQEQLNNVKRQIREMEQNGVSLEQHKKYKQLKHIKTELQTNIRQMKSYVKKG